MAETDYKTFPADGVGGLSPGDFWRNRAKYRLEEHLTRRVMADGTDRPVEGAEGLVSDEMVGVAANVFERRTGEYGINRDVFREMLERALVLKRDETDG